MHVIKYVDTSQHPSSPLPADVGYYLVVKIVSRRPLNLVLYMPFRIFTYSSNIFKVNFDLMESIPSVGTLRSVGTEGSL